MVTRPPRPNRPPSTSRTTRPRGAANKQAKEDEKTKDKKNKDKGADKVKEVKEEVKDKGKITIPTRREAFNIAEARRSVVFLKVLSNGIPVACGSGFLVSKEGVIYTNRHVLMPDAVLPGYLLLAGVPRR